MYIDVVFLTTNLPFDQMKARLDRANTKDENMHISYSIGSIVQFLDVLIENNNRQLKTSALHKPAAEPYILPFLSDHPHHIHRGTIKVRLLRAARLCSHVDDFDKERLNIEFTLLLNGYPPRFISYHFKKIFENNNAMSIMEQLDEVVYEKIHRQLLIQSTRREKQQEQNSNKKEIRVYFTFQSGPMLNFKCELK